MPETTGETSDGYHTFNELYEHRHVLFLSLLKSFSSLGWKSRLHDDGTSFDGYFIAGLLLEPGMVTYHIPDRYWDTINDVRSLDTAPPWDGHTSADVLVRLADHFLNTPEVVK